MSNFQAHNRIIEIVEHDSNLLFVLNRFGIRLGFGDISVQQACTNNNIDLDFFLTIINVYHNDNYFPEQKFIHFKVTDILNYLIETHNYYRQFVMPDIERLFNVLLSNEQSQRDIIKLLEKIFLNFKTDFNWHLEYEENTIFPLILELDNKVKGSEENAQKIENLNFVNIHSQLDDNIIDIKNLLIKHLPPIADSNNFNAFTIAILKFEKDLKDHAKIEDLILYPRMNIYSSKNRPR